MTGRWLVLLAACGALSSGCDAGGGGSEPSSPGSGRAGAAPESLAEVSAAASERARVAVGDRCLDVEVADTDDERGRGLMDRDEIGDADGMLFVWDHDVDAGFFMYRTHVPLTIGWYRANGSPLDRADMRPCPAPDPRDCPVYRPDGPYRYALEVDAGSLASGALAPCS